MPAATANLYVEQGTSYSGTVVLHDAPTSAGGLSTPHDLTGCSADMQIRASYDAPTALLTLSTQSNGGLALGGTTGSVTVAMTPAQTGALPVRGSGVRGVPTAAYVYDLVLTYPSGSVVRALQGIVTVVAGVTFPAGTGGPQ